MEAKLMTRLSDLKEKLIIKDKVMALGDDWHNEDVNMLFEGLKSNKFNLDLLTVVYNLATKNGTEKVDMHSLSKQFTKGQLRKINAICKAKTEATKQKRMYSLMHLLTSGIYSGLFNKKQLEALDEFCKSHNLQSGLVRVNRVKHMEAELNNLLASM